MLTQIKERRGAEDHLQGVERGQTRCHFLRDPRLVAAADRRAVGPGQRPPVGALPKRFQLRERRLRLETVGTEYGDLLRAATRLGERTIDLDFPDADVRQLAQAQQLGAIDAGLALMLIRIALVGGEDGLARLVGTVGKDEARRPTGLQPDAE